MLHKPNESRPHFSENQTGRRVKAVTMRS